MNESPSDRCMVDVSTHANGHGNRKMSDVLA